MEQSPTKSRKRTIAVVVGSLALVGLLAVGASALQGFLEGADADAAAGSGNAGSAEPATGAAEGGAGAIGEWTAVETGLTWAEAFLAAPETLYLLSTAPGVSGVEAPTRQALYSSADAETWDVAVLGGEMWVNDLTEREGTLYAIGTAPGTSDREAVIGIRAPDDDAFAVTPLATDFAGPPPGLDGGTNRSVSIAGSDAIVAAVATQVWGDYSSLLPEGVVSDNRGYVETAEGIAVVDWDLQQQAMMACNGDGTMGAGPAGERLLRSLPAENTTMPEEDGGAADPAVACDPNDIDPFVVHRATWEELGLGANPSIIEIYVSADGESFEKVETDLPGGHPVQLHEVDDGFVALASSWPASSAWHSPDGRSWTELKDLPAMDSVTTAGSIGGRIVVAGSRSGVGPVLAVYDDPGATPQIVEPAGSLVDLGGDVWLASAAIDNGVAVLMTTTWDPGASTDRMELRTSTDLESWTSTPATDMVGDMNAQAGPVLVTAQGIYAQFMAYDSRPDAPWHPIHLMAIAERG